MHDAIHDVPPLLGDAKAAVGASASQALTKLMIA